MSVPDTLKSFIKKYSKTEYKPCIVVDDIPDVIPYSTGLALPRNGIHLGQRKLGLSEIQFLTEHPCAYVVYAGSSPSQKIYYISRLFPDTKFVLIDPRKPEIFIDDKRTVFSFHNANIPVEIREKFMDLGETGKNMTADLENLVDTIRNSSARIFTIRGYFNNKLAQTLAPLGANFISDIRSITERADIGPQDLDVLWNLSQQYNWMRIMNPPVSCVKFRQLFYNSDAMDYFYGHYDKDLYRKTFEDSKEFGIDFVKNYTDKIWQYPKGEVYLQAWMGLSSTETRLHILRKDLENIVDYNTSDYEDKFNFYNVFYRCLVKHKNPYTSKKLCIDKCNDCGIEVVIWENYIKKVKKDKVTKEKIWEYIDTLGKYSKPLCHEWHNGEDMTKDRVQEMIIRGIEERTSRRAERGADGGMDGGKEGGKEGGTEGGMEGGCDSCYVGRIKLFSVTVILILVLLMFFIALFTTKKVFEQSERVNT